MYPAHHFHGQINAAGNARAGVPKPCSRPSRRTMKSLIIAAEPCSFYSEQSFSVDYDYCGLVRSAMSRINSGRSAQSTDFSFGWP
jgi:hypothetical protein